MPKSRLQKLLRKEFNKHQRINTTETPLSDSRIQLGSKL